MSVVETWILVVVTITAASSVASAAALVYFATYVRSHDIKDIGTKLDELAREIRLERADLKAAVKAVGEELQIFVKSEVQTHEDVVHVGGER
jgi:low affinity Fe/Cu permease